MKMDNEGQGNSEDRSFQKGWPSWVRMFGALVGAGAVLGFYSELFFLNEEPTQSFLQTLALGFSAWSRFSGEMLFWYACFSAWLIFPMGFFRVKTLQGFFLCACLFGWAVEGIPVPVLYEDVPFSLVWPSVGWHALVDVGLGIVLVRRILGSRQWKRILLCFVVLGFFWGIWAYHWLPITKMGRFPATEFIRYVFTATTWPVFGYCLLDRCGMPRGDFASKAGGACLAIFVLTGLVINASITPWQFLFPALVFMAMAQLRFLERKGGISFAFLPSSRPRVIHYGLIWAMPGTAGLVYVLFSRGNLDFHLTYGVVGGLMVIGTLLLAFSFLPLRFKH